MAVPPGPQWVQYLFNEVVIQSCWRGYILVRAWGLDQGLEPKGKGQKGLLRSLPRTPPRVHFSPCRLQILGPTSQGYHLHILHPCLSFLWLDLVPHLRTLARGEGSLGMVTLQVMIWPGFRVPRRSPLRAPHLSLFKFLQENSQGQHLLRPFWHPGLRWVITEHGWDSSSNPAGLLRVRRPLKGFVFHSLSLVLFYTEWHLEAHVEGSAGWWNTFF